MMHTLTKTLERSAQEWGVFPRVAVTAFWMPLVGSVVVALMLLNRQLYTFVTMEDGPLEWSQFVLFALAAVAAAWIAALRLKVGHRWQALLWGVLAVALFFVSGEEISWGQRIVGIATPPAYMAVNKQGEINLHNNHGVLAPIRIVMMLGSLYGAIAFLLNRRLRIELSWGRADVLFVPPIFLAPAFLVMFAYRLVRMLFWPTSSFTVTKYSEWAEFCLAIALCGFTWLVFRRLSAPLAVADRAKPSLGHASVKAARE